MSDHFETLDIADSVRQDADSHPAVTVDLTAPAIVWQFMRSCRFWLSVALVFCMLSLLESRTGLSIGVFLAAALLCFMSHFLLRHPRTVGLLAWTWVVVLATATVALWSFLQFLLSFGTDFSAGLVIQLALTGAFFAVSYRALAQDENMVDRDTDMFAPVTTMGLSESGSDSDDRTSFVDIWLSGGWRSILLLALPWALFTPKIGPACFYFGLSLGCVISIPLFFLPVIHALHKPSTASFLRAMAENQASRGHQSYGVFVLAQAMRHPSAIIWFVASGVALLIAIGFLILPLPEEIAIAKGTVTLFGVGAALYCLRLGRRHALQVAATDGNSGVTDFTLYLRSFVDDQVEVLRDGFLYRVWIVDRLFDTLRYIRFEEIIAGTLWPFGPAVAIDRPGDSLPQSGALRIKALPDNWQDVALDLSRRARKIIMTVGFTRGLQWEFEHIAKSLDLHKLSLVVLPNPPDITLSTWRAFAGDSSVLRSCPDEVITQTIVVRFDPANNMPVFLVAQHPAVASYRLALEACCLPLERLIETRDATDLSRTSENPIR